MDPSRNRPSMPEFPETSLRIRPATTMVQVSRLISPDMLVEIEADAVMT